MEQSQRPPVPRELVVTIVGALLGLAAIVYGTIAGNVLIVAVGVIVTAAVPIVEWRRDRS